jgi:hypothetical protein
MLSLAAFVLGSIGVTIYIKHALYPKTPKKHLRYLLAFQLSVALITLIYSFFILTGFEMPVQIKIYHMKTLFGILFSIQLLVITLILLKEANDNHYVAKRLLLVFLTLCITLVIDFVILSLPENNYGALSTWKWGILVCIVTFTAIYIHRALNYKKDISNLKNVPASHMHTGASKSSSKQDIPDYLTGLLTRPSIYRLIESTLETSKLTKASFTLAFFD